MGGNKTNSKKPTKSERNVLVQPFHMVWPTIQESDLDECTRYLQEVNSSNIVTGCNEVIKLLQNGQAAALFLLESFSPRSFGKLIIRMACRQNPALLVLAIPSMPTKTNDNNSMLLAITKPTKAEPSTAIKNLLQWMKKVGAREGHIRKLRVGMNTGPRQRKPVEDRKQPDKPVTEEEVAKLYILEPVGATAQRSNEKDSFGSSNFISFSSNDRQIEIKSNPADKPVGPQSYVARGSKHSYQALKVNRVKGNPNRVEHKKQRRSKSRNKP